MNLISPALKRLSLLDKQVTRLRGLASHLLRQIVSAKKERKDAIRELRWYKLALRRIQDVGVETQKKTVYRIEKLVTYAIRDVFGEDGYDFKLELSYSDKSMSVDFYLERDGECFDPLECCSYGVVDVMCFALRIAIWSLSPGRKTLIFDEPFKNVSKEYRERVGQFVRKISEELDFQFIIVTHMPELSENAHRNFHLVKKGKETVLCKQ